MLEYALKLTNHPEKMIGADVDRLRTAGLSDEAILRVNLIVSYFNFVNRIVSGLGVQLEDKESRIYKY
jgi:alkylhydroperoxidase family enzyme